MAAVSIGLASSENALPMRTRLHHKLALALVSHKYPATQVRLDQTNLPGLTSCGQRLLKIEGISAELGAVLPSSKAPQKFGNASQKRHAKMPARSRVVALQTFRHSQVGDHCFIHFSRPFTSCFCSLPASWVRLARNNSNPNRKASWKV
jgi:hypothetical protein